MSNIKNIRLAISVEGYTEYEFANKVLSPFLREYDIYLYPVIIRTSSDKSGIKYKGGGVNLDRIKSELKKILPNYDFTTTFYDYYGFKFNNNIIIDKIESELISYFNSRKLIPYIQKYEFETLLFSDSEYYKSANFFFGDNAEEAATEVEKIINHFSADAESINNSVNTVPSKRIAEIFEKYSSMHYRKPNFGIEIVSGIGLNKIRNSCHRFNEWLKKLTALPDLA